MVDKFMEEQDTQVSQHNGKTNISPTQNNKKFAVSNWIRHSREKKKIQQIF